MKKLRIATRNSPLALWQAEDVKARIEALGMDVQVELVKMTTRGDQLLDSPLAKIGGKGLFVKELETAMLDGGADIAVHSIKDVPAVLPEGLQVVHILERENPHDAFVSNQFQSAAELPERAIVGTCSLRRQAQLLARYPHLEVHNTVLYSRKKHLQAHIGRNLGRPFLNKHAARGTRITSDRAEGSL